MKHILLVLVVALSACGDDDSSKTNTNTSNFAKGWSITGDLTTSGDFAAITLSSFLTIHLINEDGLSIQMIAMTTNQSPATFTTATNAIVQLSSPEYNCGNIVGPDPAYDFSFTIDTIDFNKQSATGTFTGELPCSDSPLDSISIDGRFNF